VSDRREDLIFVIDARAREDHPRVTGIRHERDRVVPVQVLDQHAQCLLRERQLVGLVHRARDVDEEH